MLQYEFDDANRMKSVKSSLLSGNPDGCTYFYDKNSQIDIVEYPNGVTADYDYDDTGRISEYSYKNKSGNFINRKILLRNALGYKKEEEIIAGMELMPIMQMQQSRTHSPADKLNQITTTPSTKGTAPQTTTYIFDNNGNLLSDSRNSFSYQFDYENRLTKIVNRKSKIQNYFDDLGDRIRRTENGETRFHVLDKGATLHNVLAEYDSAGNIKRSYIWGANGLIAQLKTQNSEFKIHYFCSDELGSTLAITDDSGEVVDEICYTAYGEISNRKFGFDTPYLYIGGHGVYYEGLNLYNMKARFYDSALKRFINKDPSGIEGGFNLYANANPLFYVDPTGFAYFALRPLGGSSWQSGASHNPIDDYLNTEIAHEQIFFEDKKGENIGFFDDGTIKQENKPSGYRITRTGYDDKVLRQAVNDTNLKPYHLLWQLSPNKEKFNCQDWAEAVRDNYETIELQQTKSFK